MALKIANTAVVDDSGNFVGEFGGLVVNNRLVFDDTRCSPVQGTVSGYVSGGRTDVPAPNNVDTIEKYPFAADTNAADVGELSCARSGVASSSSLHGYVQGDGTIEKFPFATDGPGTNVGNLIGSNAGGGSGHSSEVSGYQAGGAIFPPFSRIDTIQKFSFSSDGNATDVGEITCARDQIAGQSSKDNGYSSGGNTPPYVNIIEKFPFSSDTNAADVGDLLNPVTDSAGQSSCISGYTSGGYGSSPGGPGVSCNTIQKFPFATDANATDVGEIFCTRRRVSGSSSISNGYTHGGQDVVAGVKTEFDKFPFASDTNASDVGELTQAKIFTAGNQV